VNRVIGKLCYMTVVATALAAWAAQPAGAIVSSETPRPFLLGTIEFRGVPLGGWHRFSDKVAESLGVLSRCARSLARCPESEVAALLANTAKLRGTGPVSKLMAVNRLANRQPYRSDLANFHTIEHWASPLEFLARSGDCEDYAIFKYALLRHLGMPADSLRIVLLRHKADGLGHAVLAAYVDNKVYILDNADGPIRPQDEVKNYIPVFSFNENARWAHIESSPGRRPATKSWALIRAAAGRRSDLHDEVAVRPGQDGAASFARLYAAVFSPATPSPKEYRVQIGAFRSLENANDLWQRVWRDQWDLLAKSEPHIFSQSFGDGGQLHLLQVGATQSARQAKALCDTLSARGVDCFVVKPAATGRT
jgi:predicted transglutaminase-like cysteine proteinase